jgi:hypothetical protein
MIFLNVEEWTVYHKAMDEMIKRTIIFPYPGANGQKRPAPAK